MKYSIKVLLCKIKVCFFYTHVILKKLRGGNMKNTTLNQAKYNLSPSDQILKKMCLNTYKEGGGVYPKMSLPQSDLLILVI